MVFYILFDSMKEWFMMISHAFVLAVLNSPQVVSLRSSILRQGIAF